MYDIEEFNIKINEENHKKIKLKLIEQKNIIINIFKDMKSKGLIKSLRIPHNKKWKKEIKELVEIKKELNKSIRYITNLY